MLVYQRVSTGDLDFSIHCSKPGTPLPAALQVPSMAIELVEMEENDTAPGHQEGHATPRILFENRGDILCINVIHINMCINVY